MAPLDQLFVLDIETVSQYKNYEDQPDLWKKLWAQKIEKQLPEGETPESFYSKRAAILAEFGKIICISAGYFKVENGKTSFRIKSYASDEEKILLQNFVNDAAQWQAKRKNASFAGHNIKEFDIPYICRRMLCNQMPIPAWLDFQSMKPWETNLEDTMALWRFGDYKNYTSLNLLAACMGVPSPKDDIDGSQVVEVYWEMNDLARIVEYCQKDVVTVAQLLLNFRQMPHLKEGDIEVVS